MEFGQAYEKRMDWSSTHRKESIVAIEKLATFQLLILTTAEIVQNQEGQIDGRVHKNR